MPARGAPLVAEVADVGRGVGVRRPQRTQYFESAACWRTSRARTGSSRPNRTRSGRESAESADQRIVGVHDAASSRPAARRRRPPALGDQLQLAVAVELVAEEVSEHTARGRRRPATSGKAPSSTSNSPSSASRAESSVEATPEARFAPEAVPGEPEAPPENRGGHRGRRRLAVRRRDDGRPEWQPRRERVDRPGSIFQSSLPGSVVPPPRPAGARGCRRDRASRRLEGERASWDRAYPRLTRSALCPGRSGPSTQIFANYPICSTMLAMASGKRRYQAIEGIDAAALEAFRAGSASATPTSRSSTSCGPPPSGSAVADDARVRRRPGDDRPSADGDRALRHLERGKAAGRAASEAVRYARGAARPAARAGRASSGVYHREDLDATAAGCPRSRCTGTRSAR